ncbi:tetratricopeptide repeat protein [Thalassotalea castellviae]|uniref:Tetratricopeptide repeat protein n=1 Tax=Thalassotalea castellviae TaxID=3075612 RepID=A0ABU3A2E7_9GAMM|nr:tetratricopeptide repeat protein [Thalassotalea sp. W431]MDT0604356.1 tetratricopeptide repeat protein [Thalassotalea sp. W431]
MDSKRTKEQSDLSRTFVLGAWSVDGDSNQLIKAGERFVIEPKMMDVLIYLCQHIGETVSAEQLLIACWSGTFYGDAPVQKCIAGLRKKLGCNAKNPSYIETIYRRGYKIIAEVEFPTTANQVSERQSLQKWTKGSPYLGLSTFHQHHSNVYFGRTKAIVDVISQLKTSVNRANNFLLLLGKSGSGKSSLIRAGVLPFLNSHTGFSQLRVTQYHIVSPSQSIDESPIATLVHALVKLNLIHTSIELPTLISQIADDPFALKSALKDIPSEKNEEVKLEQSQQVKDYKLLVIDQFERFLLDEDLTKANKQNLVNCLTILAQCQQLLFIAILRNDFYAECLDVNGFYELKDQGKQYDLQAPTPVEITRMIRNPAIAAGLSFEYDEKTEERLDEILLAAAVKNPDALPLLEYTLDLLYQQRNRENVLLLSAYRKMGGIEGAIAQQAEKVFNELPKSVQACWDNILHALIQVDHKNKHNVTARKVPINFFKKPDEKKFIQHFLNARLFVTLIQTNTGEQRRYSTEDRGYSAQNIQFISIAHEALLQHWQRIKLWLNNNSVALHKREQLAEDCQFWLDNHKANDALLNSKQKVLDAQGLIKSKAITLNDNELAFIKRSKRYQERKKLVLSFAVIALMGFSILTWFQAKQVTKERDIALLQSQKTKAISKFLTDTLAASSPFVAQGKEVSLLDVLIDAGKKLNDPTQNTYPAHVEALLHKTLGLIYIDLGKIAPAEQHLSKGFDIYKENQLEKDEGYLGLLFNFSRLNNLKYGMDDLTIIKETIDVSKTIYGDDHKDTLGALDNLGSYYLNNKEFAQAEDIFTQVYQKRREFFGENFRHTLYSVENLGDLYYTQQDYKQAEQYYQLCYEQWLNKSGISNPYSLFCLKGLALTKLANGQYPQAENLLTQLIKAATLVYGSEHPEVLEANHYLAKLFMETTRVKFAEALFRQTLQARTVVLGGNHKDTLETKAQLTQLLNQHRTELN